MRDIIVVGGGGHAKVVISVLKKSGYAVKGYSDKQDRGVILGVPYLGNDKVLQGIVMRQPGQSAIIGIGKIDVSRMRLDLQNRMSTIGFDFPVVCSPHAIVNESVTLGAGTAVFDGVIINSGTKIGRACILNTGSTIDHDCLIGENVHIAPGSTLSGGVAIGDNCMMGTGVNVIQSISICAGTLIGAGAVVLCDVTEPGTYVGNPAKRVK
jgi:UDP-perosamine 4-acetyltransferase